MAVIESVLELVARLIAAALLLVVMLPAALIVATPFIFLGSILVRGAYVEHAKKAFIAVSKKWLDWGIYVFP